MMLIYADPSAFVKLWISEDHTEYVRQILQDSANVTACSAIGRVEIVGALRRAHKGGRLARSRFAKILREIREKWGAVVVVATIPEVIDSAEECASKFALRGYDAVHLASLLYPAQSGTPPALVSCDDELVAAAAKCGIHVLDPDEESTASP